MTTIQRLIAALFIIALLFTGCSREKPESSDISSDITDVQDKKEKDDEKEKSEKTEKKDDSEKETPAASKGGIYTEPGMEMNDFYDAFNGAMGRFEKAVNSYEPDDFDLFDVGFDFIAPTINIVGMTQFDYLELGDNPKETGKNGNFDAIREKNGDIITFSESMTNEEDGFARDDLKGDVKENHGTLNTKTNTLIHEGTTTRDGQVIARKVTEVVMLPDGTFLAQCFEKPKKPYDDRIEDKGTAHFIYCSKDKLEIITAHFDPNVNFTYESILDKPDATPETMSEGYKKVRQLLVENDEAAAMKY
ncbi:MAG: hypothetical protein GX236_10185 [Clostridiaceae bacterium]|nr:hypothetical protein [Clostridiaceae bacterium]